MRSDYFEVDNSVYFAAVPTEDVGPYVLNRVMQWDEYLSNSGMLSLLRRSYRAYYGYATNDFWHQSSNIVFDGEQGELALMKMNDYRSILTNFLSLIMAQRLNFDPRAINNDTESLAQTIVAQSVIEDSLKNKGMRKNFSNVVELALWGAEGFVHTCWDRFAGKPIGFDEQNQTMHFEGDTATKVFLGMDVARDPQTKSIESCNYFILRDWQNKFELAAKYPDFKEEILGCGDESQMNRMGRFLTPMQWSQRLNQDYIPVYTMIHKATVAVPGGRYSIVVGSGDVLEDGPLTSESTMLHRVAMADIKDTSLGYTLAFDLLGPQMAQDSVLSTCISNINTYGVQNMLVPKGADLNFSALAGGLNIITHNPERAPTAMQLIQTPPEAYKLIEIMVSSMGRLSNISSVNRGQPEASLKSGSALALVASQALQFINILQASYVEMAEGTMSNIIELYQQNVSEPRMLELAGRDKAQYIQSFSGKDLDKIKRVYIDLGNPLSRTPGGRQELADNLLDKGMIKTAQEYLTILTTGTLEPAVNNPVSIEMLIKEENDRIMRGEPVVAVATDLHFEHILGHSAPLNTYKNRLDPRIAQNTTTHIQEHLDQLRVVNPALLQMMGQQSLAAPEVPSQGESPMTNSQKGEKKAPSSVETSDQPNMPRMPTEPISGEQYQPQVF
jgi:hypothetical protein